MAFLEPLENRILELASCRNQYNLSINDHVKNTQINDLKSLELVRYPKIGSKAFSDQLKLTRKATSQLKFLSEQQNDAESKQQFEYDEDSAREFIDFRLAYETKSFIQEPLKILNDYHVPPYKDNSTYESSPPEKSSRKGKRSRVDRLTH